MQVQGKEVVNLVRAETSRASIAGYAAKMVIPSSGKVFDRRVERFHQCCFLALRAASRWLGLVMAYYHQSEGRPLSEMEFFHRWLAGRLSHVESHYLVPSHPNRGFEKC